MYGAIEEIQSEQKIAKGKKVMLGGCGAACGLLFLLLLASFAVSSMKSLLPSTTSSLSFGANINSVDNSTVCVCPDIVKNANCSDMATPVLGGLDFVQYFTDFINSDGSYDEDKLGLAGSSEFKSVYNSYTFYFLSVENKQIFEANPSRYVPQYGGFCSYGMAAEYCDPTNGEKEFAWSATCLGPSGNWGQWTIYNDKLYFFMGGKPTFINNEAALVANGDERWASWGFDNNFFNTNCYSANADDNYFVELEIEESK